MHMDKIIDFVWVCPDHGIDDMPIDLGNRHFCSKCWSRFLSINKDILKEVSLQPIERPMRKFFAPTEKHQLPVITLYKVCSECNTRWSDGTSCPKCGFGYPSK